MKKPSPPKIGSDVVLQKRRLCMVNMSGGTGGTGIPILSISSEKGYSSRCFFFPRFVVVHPVVAVAFFGWKEDGYTLVN